MKKTMSQLLILVLSIGALGATNTYAADDFEALLNALSDGDSVETTVEPTVEPTTDPVMDNSSTTTSNEGEVDLDSLSVEDVTPAETIMDNSTPTVSTYSNEASIEDNVNTVNTAYEPEEDYAYEPEMTNSVDNELLNGLEGLESDAFATTNDNSAPLLTMTGLPDYVYGLLFIALVSGVALVRRRNK